MLRHLLIVLSCCLTLSTQAAERPSVVTTFSILADLVTQIGGEDVALTNLVGADADAHVFEPSPRDIRALLGADLVIANGLGFEPWLGRVLAEQEARGSRIDASAGVVPLMLEEDGNHLPDPHAWQSLDNARTYARNIARALTTIDPANGKRYKARLDAWLAQLEVLHGQLAPRLLALPERNRRVLTSHDAFGYFAQSWQLQFVAVQGLSEAAEPSAGEVAALIRLVREHQVRAVFVENIRDPRMITQIAEESGVQVGGTLYSDALAAEGPASTFLGMYRHNAETLLQALGH